jgi:biopolymer transport protein TolR
MAGALITPARGGGRAGRRRARLVADINVTPFVDVMLVLLVIFMITAPLLTAAVQVDLPRTQAAQATGQDEPLVISINAEGKTFLQETELDMDTLIARLRAILQNKADQRIFVRGDKGLAYGKIMEIMGALSSAGFSKVALVAEVPSGAATPSRPGRPAAPAGR